MPPVTAPIKHEPFCRPRPEADEPRTETFTVPKYGPDDVTRIGFATTHRCLECGAAEYVHG